VVTNKFKQRTKDMITETIVNSSKGEIVSFVYSDRFSFSDFRRKQRKLMTLGFKLHNDVSAVVCPDCGVIQSTLSYSKDGIEMWFDACPECWTFVESYPVYENDQPVELNKLDDKLSLLNMKQICLVDGIISVLIDQYLRHLR
jgi:hypothetical protein